MTLPILANHDTSRPLIGVIDVHDGRLEFRFSAPVKRDRVFEIFGNAGIRFTELELDENGIPLVVAGVIFEFSSP